MHGDEGPTSELQSMDRGLEGKWTIGGIRQRVVTTWTRTRGNCTYGGDEGQWPWEKLGHVGSHGAMARVKRNEMGGT